MKFTAFLLLLLAPYLSFAQRIKQIPPDKPKLIVGIVVEQMRADYIQKFWSDFGDNGFKRLVNYGTVCQSAELGYGPAHSASGFATLATGALPVSHGIVGDEWYNRVSGEREFAVADDKYKVVGGRPDGNQYSPEKLTVNTFADELRLHYGAHSKSVSISLNPVASVVLAGHLAGGAYWFDANTGNMVTSNYYTHALPAWVNAFNAKKIPDIYLVKPWETSKLITDYSNSQPDKNRFEVGYNGFSVFPYLPTVFAKSPAKYTPLLMYPSGNSLVKDFAIHAIVGDSLGKDSIPDLLSISFSATQQIGTAFGTESIELRDAYIKLDKEIAFLLDFLSSEVGQNNMLLYLTSNHGLTPNTAYLESLNMPAGQFKHRQAVALLGSYLNAVYGNGDWVSQYSGLQFYLNHILIENSRLSLADVQERAAQFLIQLTGVAQVYTSAQLQSPNSSDVIFMRHANAFNRKRSGDLQIVLQPGWTEQVIDKSCVNSSAYNPDNQIPLIWYGWKIEKSKIYATVSLADVAPTLSSMLDMPLPSAATGKPIIQLFQK